MIIGILLVIGIIIIGIIAASSKDQQTPTAPQSQNQPQQPVQTENQTTITEIIPGSFDLKVIQCYGNKLRVLNNGTGTILLNSSTLVQESGGTITYGKVVGEYVLQPGQYAIIQISKDLKTINTTSHFKLTTMLANERGGTTYYYSRFEC